MKQFLAVYTGSATSREKSGWDSMDSDERARLEGEGINAWGNWMKKHQNEIVVTGGPLGKTKSVSSDGISDVVNNLAGYVIIEAETYDDAAAKFVNHPHFAIFPGDAVEIMECLPIPGM